MFKKKFVHNSQHEDNDCAVACVLSILEYHNIFLNYSLVENLLKTNSSYGTNAFNIKIFF